MSDASFQSFIVIGLLCLIGAIVFLAFQVWRWRDLTKDSETQSLAGIGHELRHTLNRTMYEISLLRAGNFEPITDMMPVSHPQMDALLSRATRADRRTMSYIRGLYDELEAQKTGVRTALARGIDTGAVIDQLSQSVVNGLAMLYLWEKHAGRPPAEAHATRSWYVRDWLKAEGHDASVLPGRHLRDEVVECLRGGGMKLTPKPLSHTAHEYYAKRYDRKADPNAPFWKRKLSEATSAEPVAEA